MAEKRSRRGRGLGFYEELQVDAVFPLLEQEGKEQELDTIIEREDDEMPEGVYEVERLVERRVRKVNQSRDLNIIIDTLFIETSRVFGFMEGLSKRRIYMGEGVPNYCCCIEVL